MANELNLALTETGITDLVARIYLPNWSQQGGDIAMAEVGGATGRYSGSVPGSLLASREYAVLFYQTTPNPDQLSGEGALLWDVSGDKEIIGGELTAEIWKDRGLDPDADKTILENTVGESYTENAEAISKAVDKVGNTTTIARS